MGEYESEERTCYGAAQKDSLGMMAVPAEAVLGTLDEVYYHHP